MWQQNHSVPQRSGNLAQLRHWRHTVCRKPMLTSALLLAAGASGTAMITIRLLGG